MDDLKIGKALEKEMEKESKSELNSAINQEVVDSIDPSSEGKKLLILIAVIIGVFALTFGGFNIYNQITAADVVDVDKLHQDNLAGDLSLEEGYVYNGFSFIYADRLWWSEIKQPDRILKIPLHFGPREVENITVTGKLDPRFNLGEEVYMAIDPYYSDGYYTLALSELNNNIASGIRKMPVSACTENNTEICGNRFVLNCGDTKNKPVIQLQPQGPTGIELKGTCILIKGEKEDLVRAANRLIWQWYGVMK